MEMVDKFTRVTKSKCKTNTEDFIIDDVIYVQVVVDQDSSRPGIKFVPLCRCSYFHFIICDTHEHELVVNVIFKIIHVHVRSATSLKLVNYNFEDKEKRSTNTNQCNNNK